MGKGAITVGEKLRRAKQRLHQLEKRTGYNHWAYERLQQEALLSIHSGDLETSRKILKLLRDVRQALNDLNELVLLDTLLREIHENEYELHRAKR